MKADLNEVRKHVELYFKEHLPQYTVLEIRKKSYHPDDCYLYMVSAGKEDGTYAVWTSWNETTQSLNHGYYGIKYLDDCVKLLNGWQNTTKYFEVYRYANKVKERMFVTDSEEQAKQFCEDNNWKWKDEHGFLWSMNYCET